MAVAWRAVKDRLVAALPAVVGAGVEVFDGPTVTGKNPAAYLMVGSSPSQSDGTGAGTFEQVVGPDGFSVEERGSVVCEAGAVSGRATIPDVFATFDAVASFVQSDMTLGGTLGPGSTVTVQADVSQGQTSSGAVQRLTISVNYFTRL